MMPIAYMLAAAGFAEAGWSLWRAPWGNNPWVVAITFRPVLGNIDRVAE